jgi:small-conductance mechanosensitive channel
LCCLGQVGGQQVGEEYLQKLVNEVENLKRELLDNVLSKKRVALTSELQDKHIVEVESQLRKSLENNEVLQRKIEGLGT